MEKNLIFTVKKRKKNKTHIKYKVMSNLKQKLHEKIKPEIQIREVNANMEDPTFAEAVVAAALEIFS